MYVGCIYVFKALQSLVGEEFLSPWENGCSMLRLYSVVPLQGVMINTRKKILKEKGAAPTSLEEEVAKALFDIEVSPSCDFKAELREIYISNATEIEVGKGGAAVIVHIPFRAWKFAKKIQARLIKELEKKFSRKHVILVANRTILDKDFRRKGMKVRPRSRTLTAVHEAILEDVVGPTEIVGKRTRIGVDGSKTMKILLDPRDKDWRFGTLVEVKLKVKPSSWKPYWSRVACIKIQSRFESKVSALVGHYQFHTVFCISLPILQHDIFN